MRLGSTRTAIFDMGGIYHRPSAFHVWLPRPVEFEERAAHSIPGVHNLGPFTQTRLEWPDELNRLEGCVETFF